jgi:transmembrane sensor
MNAESIEARAAAWLIRRREHESWSEPDQTELDAWLAESWAHATAFWRLGAAWSSADRLGVLRRPEPEQGMSPTRRARRSFLIAIAAGLVAAALLGVAGSKYLTNASEKTYATALGGHEMIALADGSMVELNTDTIVHVSVDASRRVVTLDRGEAYFQIRHDTARSFIVLAAGHRVIDVGTKFLLRRDAERVEVALIEGRARFESASAGSQTQSPLLTPGDVVVATADSVLVTRKSAPDLANELGWRRNLLVFHHTTLADAASEYNRYNSNKIVIADRFAAHLTMNGTLPTNDVEAFVRLTQKFFDLRVERRGDQIVISR